MLNTLSNLEQSFNSTKYGVTSLILSKKWNVSLIYQKQNLN
jgi:hypothetical protein